MTLLGIAYVRLSHGLHVNFEVHTAPGEAFVVLIAFLSIQLVFGLLGYHVMKRVGYFEEFVWGEGRNPGSYALICPGVALFVFGMFVLHMGLVRTGVVAQFSVPYFVILAVLVALQAQTIRTLLVLDRKLLD